MKRINIKQLIILLFGLGLFLFCPFLLKSVNAQMYTLCVPAYDAATICVTKERSYIPPPAPAFPDEISGHANWTYSANTDGTYDIDFTFNNPDNRNVSISINPTEYADPGPDPDTSGSNWTFTEVQPETTQYVNMKAMVNGSWSQIDSWIVQVPAWVAPTDTPDPSTQPSEILTQSANSSPNSQMLLLLAIMVGIFTIFVILSSYFKHNFTISKKSKHK
jgi:hypothetical protein